MELSSIIARVEAPSLSLSLKIAVFWDVTLCSARSAPSKRSVHFYQTIRRHILEDSKLHRHRRENLHVSNIAIGFFLLQTLWVTLYSCVTFIVICIVTYLWSCFFSCVYKNFVRDSAKHCRVQKGFMAKWNWETLPHGMDMDRELHRVCPSDFK
jgi:hypothetical protein